jgi:hypothetical protein
MRKVLFVLLVIPGVLPAQGSQEPARPASGGVSGRWVVNTVRRTPSDPSSWPETR